MAQSTENTECPKCGKDLQDLRALNGHLRMGHGMSTEEIREVLAEAKPGEQQLQQTDEAEPVEVEVEEISNLPALHASSNRVAPVPTESELPHDLSRLQDMLREVRRYRGEAEEMMSERGLFEDDEAERNLVALWKNWEERLTAKIVQIGERQGVTDEPSFLDRLFGLNAVEEEHEEDWI